MLGAGRTETVMLCLFTGDHPLFCAPMPRDPTPPTGQTIEQLGPAIDSALRLNPAVHDGAIMLGRHGDNDTYTIKGWSYRLFPPEQDIVYSVNRGSAFQSSVLMSFVEGIDRVYLISAGTLTRFERGGFQVISENVQ